MIISSDEILLIDTQEHDICASERIFEIPKFDQVISSPKVARIGSIDS